jgi:hypothetical protein
VESQNDGDRSSEILVAWDAALDPSDWLEVSAPSVVVAIVVGMPALLLESVGDMVIVGSLGTKLVMTTVVP